MTLQILTVLILALVFLAGFGWRSARRLRRLRGRLARLHDELRTGVRQRREAAEELLAALRRAGYAPGAHEALKGATAAVAATEDSGLRELAEADERLKQALLQAYRALPPERLAEVRRAHAALAEAEDELDIARQQYNDTAHFHNTMLQRFWYRLLSPWLKARPAELYLTAAEERAFVHRYMMRP